MDIVRPLRRALALLALSSPLAALALAQAQEPIRIGSFLAVTGPGSLPGDPQAKTLEMVVDKSPTDHMGLDLGGFRMIEIRKGTWSLVK